MSTTMLMYQTIIAESELAELAKLKEVRVLDCRFDLADVDAGRQCYLKEHIPGAVYVSLDKDLSGPANTKCGRHPLPSVAAQLEQFSSLGIDSSTQVVLYDDSGGMFAARGWWMLRYWGHFSVAVLDGGWSAWCEAGRPRECGDQGVNKAKFQGIARPDRLVSLDDIDGKIELIDARDPRRFRGEIEPLDQRAGHIPGAHNHFFQQNLTQRGKFREPGDLKQAFTISLGKLAGDESVHYCGSGVSACHNILAQVHAGLDEPRLYCGSRSDWCADSGRPIAQGLEHNEPAN